MLKRVVMQGKAPYDVYFRVCPIIETDIEAMPANLEVTSHVL